MYKCLPDYLEYKQKMRFGEVGAVKIRFEKEMLPVISGKWYLFLQPFGPDDWKGGI